MTAERPDAPIRVLHVILTLGETNSQYNEHCLPMVGARDLSICTYFEPQLTPPDEIALFPGDGSLRGFFRALRAAVDAGGYDAIHAHSPHTGLLVPVALVAWRRFRRFRPSLLYTVHDSFYDYKLRNQAMMVFALAAFERIVFCSHAAYESVPRIWKRVVRNRWTVIQNGADFDRVDRVLAASPPPDRGRFTVLSVGRLEKVKDPVTLVEAFGRGTELDDHLVFVGAGAHRSAVIARAAELGLEGRVSFTGLIPRDDVFRRCAGADVFVSTSYGEGLPVAAMEAMASGCPVILSDIPPHRELIDGVDFIPLIRPGDVDGFAREIRRFRHMPAGERLELGRRGRQHVTTRFALPIMHESYEAEYRRLAGRELARTREP